MTRRAAPETATPSGPASTRMPARAAHLHALRDVERDGRAVEGCEERAEGGGGAAGGGVLGDVVEGGEHAHVDARPLANIRGDREVERRGIARLACAERVRRWGGAGEGVGAGQFDEDEGEPDGGHLGRMAVGADVAGREGEGGGGVLHRHGVEPFERAAGDEAGVSFRDGAGDGAHAEFEDHLGGAPEVMERDGGADGRVAGEGHLLRGREDLDARGVGGVRGRGDEGRLGEVELPCDFLEEGFGERRSRPG